MNAEDLGTLWITLHLAFVTTLVLLFIGTLIAWWLANSKSWFKPVVETFTALPLVLPPTVLGFYLLILFNPTTPVGSLLLEVTGHTLTFSFSGLVVASVIYSLPFMVQPLQTAFEAIPKSMMETAASLGANKFIAFITIAIPQSARGFLTAIVLSFAHTVGEFGVVLMVGGNIPGETRVMSIAIYEHVETLNYFEAHLLSGVLLAFSFCVLLIVYKSKKSYTNK